MSQVFRVKMTDTVESGEAFTFTMKYPAANSTAAKELARKEFGQDVVIVESVRVTDINL